MNIKKLIKIFLIIWLLCIITFSFITWGLKIDSSGNYRGGPTLFIVVIIGSFTFFYSIAYIFYSLISKIYLIIFKNKFRIFRFIYILIFLPYYLINEKFKEKGLKSLITFFTLLPFWLICEASVFILIIFSLGIVYLPKNVIGKSMNPTLQDGDHVFELPYFELTKLTYGLPKRGDIVVFASKNEKGEPQDFIKRVIAVGGDKLLIKGGYVFLNGKQIEEPYLEKQRSTFGNKFLSDCLETQIPGNNLFVMGDNRKRSLDSRTIGLVDIKTVNSLLPFNKQTKYQTRWHKGEKQVNISQTTISIEKYYELLNKERETKKINILKVDNKLEKASEIVAKQIIEKNQLPINITQNDTRKALEQVGYYNTIWGFSYVLGFYDEQELLNNFLEFETKNQLLDSRYQETGISAVVGKINNCEVQIIVQTFGGYVLPNYKQEDIVSWEINLNRLREILPSWEINQREESKAKFNRIVEIIKLRISGIEKIVNRMKANQWLTQEEINFTNQDKGLYDEQIRLAEELNKK